MSDVEIKPLSKEHDREGFDCEVAALNHYLKTMALQHQKKNITKTHVLTFKDERGLVIAFATLNFCEVDLTAERAHPSLKKFPEKAPALRLCKLAVDKNYKGKGIGAYLMGFTLSKAIDVSQGVGCSGIVVDAKDEQTVAYYEQYGFILFTSEPLRLFMPMKTILDLVGE